MKLITEGTLELMKAVENEAVIIDQIAALKGKLLGCRIEIEQKIYNGVRFDRIPGTAWKLKGVPTFAECLKEAFPAK